MNTKSQLAIALILLTSLTGCQRIRQMARRDYAPLNDPFAEDASGDSAFADRDQPPSSRDRTSAIAATDDLPADRNRTDQRRSGSDIRTASASRTANGDNRTRFGGIRASSMGDAIRSEIGSADEPLTSRNFEGFASTNAAAGRNTASTTSSANDKPIPGFEEWAAAQQNKFREDASAFNQEAIQTVSQTTEFVSDAANTGVEKAEAFLASAAEAAEPLVLQPPGTTAAPASFGAPASGPPAFEPEAPAFAEPPAMPANPRNFAAPGFGPLEAPNFEEAAEPLIRRPPAAENRMLRSGAPASAAPRFEPIETTPPQFDAGPFTPPTVNPARRTPPAASDPLSNTNPFADIERSLKQEANSSKPTPAQQQPFKPEFSFESGWQQ